MLFRYCKCHKNDYHHATCNNTRDAVEDHRLIQIYKSRDSKREDKTAAKNALHEMGIEIQNLSPFFILQFFRLDLWKHFGLDYLHVSLEGNWRRIFEYVGLKLGNDFCKGEVMM